MKNVTHVGWVTTILFTAAVAAAVLGVGRLFAPIENSGLVESTAMSSLMDTGRSLRADIRRVVAPAIERTQKLAQDVNVISALRDDNASRQTEVCNKAITSSTEIDAFALFNKSGKIVAINTIYASGKPVAQERVDRILKLTFDHRDIVQKCVSNSARASVLEFQTTCDITPAFFDSTGLSVAYSVPVIDPQTGLNVGVVSSRLRFERLFELTKGRTVGGTSGAMEFVTDQGKYFSEEINSGRMKPPIERATLAALVAPLVQDKAEYSFSHHGGDYLAIFRLTDFTTLGGGGIQVMVVAKEAWLASEVLRLRRVQAGAFASVALMLLLVAGLVRSSASVRRLQSATAETAQRLNMALDAGGLGSWDWDLCSNVVTFDERFGRQLGLPSTNLRFLAPDWLKCVHPDDATFAQIAVTDCLEGRSSVYVNELRARHADGSWRWILDCGKVVLRTDDGKPLRMVGTHTDITERKTTEAMLSQAQKLESIGRLAAGIAHEINTPAQYVGDNTRFVRDSFVDLLPLLDQFAQLLAAGESGEAHPALLQQIRLRIAQLDLDFLRSEIPKALEQSGAAAAR